MFCLRSNNEKFSGEGGGHSHTAPNPSRRLSPQHWHTMSGHIGPAKCCYPARDIQEKRDKNMKQFYYRMMHVVQSTVLLS